MLGKAAFQCGFFLSGFILSNFVSEKVCKKFADITVKAQVEALYKY